MHPDATIMKYTIKILWLSTIICFDTDKTCYIKYKSLKKKNLKINKDFYTVSCLFSHKPRKKMTAIETKNP